MYKSDDEVEEMLGHRNNGLVKIKIIGQGNHGNQSHEKKKTERKDTVEQKAEVAVLASLIGNKMAGEITDTHPATVSKLVNGKNTNNTPDPALVSEVDKRLGRISDKAAEKVEVLLDIFQSEKMDELKASEIPQAAEKFVGIIERIRKGNDKNNGSGVSRPVVIIHAPQQQTIEQYITKEVN